MNPEDLKEIIAEAKRRGYTESEIFSKLKEMGMPIDGSSPIEAADVGRSLVQGATFNFGDEILGVLPEWLGGGDEAKATMRSRDKAFKDEHPAIGLASEIAGGMAIAKSGGEEAVSRRAQEFADAGRGDVATLADMSRPLQRATDFAANNNDNARNVLEEAFEPRAQEVNTRITDDITSRLGAPHAEQVSDDLAKARLEWADSDAGFEGLRKKNPVVVPVMGERFDELLNQPRVKDAIAQAREVGILGPTPPANGASFEVLQGTKERLDAAVGQAFGRPGLRDLAVRLRKARDEFVGLMRQGVPGYDEVAGQYHNLHRLEEMVEHGRATYRNTDARGLKSFLAELSPEEKTRFRQGLISEMIADLRKQNAGSPALRSMVRPGANKREIMEAAFDSAKEMQEFLKRSKTEIDMAVTGRALGGSQTHGREMATVDPA
ncbi:MAG: hypothetical protein K0S14_20, partial [Thermomicrobiales bacterium]|nr:hypothetical protein [Thermomicrobiales bacterium]